MVDPHFSEEEQVERLKAWWKQNGTSVIYGAVIGLAIVVGVNYWRDYRTGRAENASALYEKMMIDYAEKQVADAEAAGANLMKSFESTPYAGKAALFLARISVEKNDLTSAKAQLRWAMEHSPEPATVHAARLRLARLLLQENQLDEVENLVQVNDMGGFDSEYQELRGDLAMLRGNAAGARDAYRAALDKLPKGSTYNELLAMKLDNAITEAGR